MTMGLRRFRFVMLAIAMFILNFAREMAQAKFYSSMKVWPQSGSICGSL